jgi:hypothetical protein
MGLAQTFEPGVDRRGSDFSDFDLPGQGPHTCQSACRQSGGCVAWTYVRAGFQGAFARCWLKSAVPDAQANAFCVSGTMPRALAPANSSATFANPIYNGYRLDWCRVFENDCGAPAADAFCKAQGFSGVSTFEPQNHMDVPTMTVGQNSVCDPKWHGCDSFASITCN